MTFAVLRALHTIIADALDDIQSVYIPEHHPSQCAQPPYASPPPSPSTPTYPPTPLDFPSLDTIYDPDDPAELLRAHPIVVCAVNKLVAAAGQLATTVQTPFLTLCDASMGYHLPSCMRLLEASHTVEILREAGPDGLHIDLLSQRNNVESSKLAHILRLLATHHIIRERAPNVFTLNRISSLVDSGKSVEQLKKWEQEKRPEMKYHNTNGIAAFIGLNTDELQKSSSYLTEAYLLSRTDPPRPPFEFAFDTEAGFFAWLEGYRVKGEEANVAPKEEKTPTPNIITVRGECKHASEERVNPNKYRLERFGTAMAGTGSWEAPGAVLNGFDWRSLPRGSIIVDVGGGIGSTSMLLANTFSSHPNSTSIDNNRYEKVQDNEIRDQDHDRGFEFVIQDREVVVEMGERAWRAKCPDLLDSGTVRFQVHDFFTEQPVKNAAVFFLRVILHDWPDVCARKILLKLREAATPTTKLVLADFVLPLACVDNIGDDSILEEVEGAESMLAPAPLLANLGKASAGAYWMDLTMQVVFNAQERTLREIVELTLSVGWKVIKVTRAVGSLFGHIIAIPVSIPMQKRARAGSGSAFFDVPDTSKSLDVQEDWEGRVTRIEVERASSRCGTPTFGSRVDLPSVRETIAKFNRDTPTLSRLPKGPSTRPGILKQPGVPTPPVKKKKPSPLSLPPTRIHTSPSTPRQTQSPTSPITQRISYAQLRSPESESPLATSPIPTVPSCQPSGPPSPMSPRRPPALARRASHAHLSQHVGTQSVTGSIPPSPSFPRHQILARRLSHAQLNQFQGVQVQERLPNSIPIRQAYEQQPLSSPKTSIPRAPPSPIASKHHHSPISRRLSYAHLPSIGSGTPTTHPGTTVGSSIGGAGVGSGISMASLLVNMEGGSGGRTLNFGGVGKDDRSGSPTLMTKVKGGSSSASGHDVTGVLAAAAQIERRVPPLRRVFSP